MYQLGNYCTSNPQDFVLELKEGLASKLTVADELRTLLVGECNSFGDYLMEQDFGECFVWWLI